MVLTLASLFFHDQSHPPRWWVKGKRPHVLALIIRRNRQTNDPSHREQPSNVQQLEVSEASQRMAVEMKDMLRSSLFGPWQVKLGRSEHLSFSRAPFLDCAFLRGDRTQRQP